jgi:hypothetical protein
MSLLNNPCQAKITDLSKWALRNQNVLGLQVAMHYTRLSMGCVDETSTNVDGESNGHPWLERPTPEPGAEISAVPAIPGDPLEEHEWLVFDVA